MKKKKLKKKLKELEDCILILEARIDSLERYPFYIPYEGESEDTKLPILAKLNHLSDK